MRYVWDTNLWLRYLNYDDEDKFELIKNLLNEVDSSHLKISISGVSVMELFHFFLKKTDLNKIEALEIIEKISKIRNLTIKDKFDTKKALKWYRKNNIKYQDCLIASSLSSKDIFVTWDKKFDVLKDEIKIITPEQLLTVLA